MSFAPIDLMMARVSKAGHDSDVALFMELLYAGEFITKLTAAALVASIADDRDFHRYRLLHSLVRADGIGEWAHAIDEALVGTASQHSFAESKDIRRVFTERFASNAWQYDAVASLSKVVKSIAPSSEIPSGKVALRSWFSLFSELRNKTRGHGAPTSAACARLSPHLKSSISLLCDRNPIFVQPWAYLHRNLSGKYKVVPLNDDHEAFKSLKSAEAIAGENYSDGVYILFGKPRLVDLVRTDVDISDFYFPNGAFNDKRFELHSLISDSRLDGDPGPYLSTATQRPPSETHGKGTLEIVGKVFTNLPPIPNAYVSRPRLEREIVEAISNDRHPIVTLVGRGGIGKTCLALTTLHEVATTTRYEAILWFSARDIDLSPVGPKVVRPQVLTEYDIAHDFFSLMGEPKEGDTSRSQNIVRMAENLRKSELSAPILFVFDNFETVRSPVDLFKWIDTNIRLPNKVVITSRFRDFKADYPIDISGMETAEANELIDRTARTLGIENVITTSLREDVLEQSGGHPYVIKIVLGEVADSKGRGKPRQIIARKEEILDALFERTFSNLSPLASRIFLTLSGWRSLVPELAVEAVLLRGQSERIDPTGAVDELVRMSLVQRITAQDGTDFLDTPLTAAIFGARKLKVSPIRTLIESDIALLQELGPTAATSLKEGVKPRIRSLFRSVAENATSGKVSFETMQPVLEFIAQSYSPAWLLLADLVQEVGGRGSINQATEYVRRYLEAKPEDDEGYDAWRKLMALYKLTGDVVGACGAFLEAAKVRSPLLYEVSNMANWLNTEREKIGLADLADRVAVFGSLAKIMEQHLAESSATDLSRLAWLHLHSGDTRRAFDVAGIGLQREPDNPYCKKLIDKLRWEI